MNHILIQVFRALLICTLISNVACAQVTPCFSFDQREHAIFVTGYMGTTLHRELNIGAEVGYKRADMDLYGSLSANMYGDYRASYINYFIGPRINFSVYSDNSKGFIIFTGLKYHAGFEAGSVVPEFGFKFSLFEQKSIHSKTNQNSISIVPAILIVDNSFNANISICIQGFL